jgi:hypothetical protein
MKARKLIVRMLILSGMALLVSCSGGATRNQSFTNEINQEFLRIECSSKDSRHKTSTLNCYMDLTMNLNRKHKNEQKKLPQESVAVISASPGT